MRGVLEQFPNLGEDVRPSSKAERARAEERLLAIGGRVHSAKAPLSAANGCCQVLSDVVLRQEQRLQKILSQNADAGRALRALVSIWKLIKEALRSAQVILSSIAKREVSKRPTAEIFREVETRLQVVTSSLEQIIASYPDLLLLSSFIAPEGIIRQIRLIESSIHDVQIHWSEARESLIGKTQEIPEVIEIASQFRRDDFPETLRMLVNTIADRRRPRKEIGFDFQIALAYPMVCVNWLALKTIIMNLVKNAAEAIRGDGTITVGVGATEEVVEIRVCDTGPGIPPELQSKIFQPFVTTKSLNGGTGLGLADSARIAQEHGGSLELVESAPGNTVFVLRLPVYRETELAA